MLAAENSDFGVTGEFLAETLVAVGTGNVDGSYQLIGLKEGWTVGLKMFKKNGTLVLHQCCIVLRLCTLCHQRLSTLFKSIVL